METQTTLPPPIQPRQPLQRLHDFFGTRAAGVFLLVVSLAWLAIAIILGVGFGSEPAFFGLQAGSRVTLTKTEPPFVIEHSSTAALSGQPYYATHRVVLVDHERSMICLSSIDGLNIELRIPFAWVGAVVDVDPILPLNRFDK